MKNVFFTLSVIVTFCFYSMEAKGQDTQGYNDMYRYVGTDGVERLVAWAETALDYNAYNYYCAVAHLYLYKDYADDTSELISYTTGTSCLTAMPDRTYGRTEVEVLYDPNVEYRIEVNHINEPIYRSPGDGSFDDYYNYYIYEDPMFGDIVWFPLSYSFNGPGPDRPSASQIILGVTYAIWTAGALAGPPHHLKVVSDNITTSSACGGELERRWKFRVVDANGRNAGRISIEEQFPGTITDSCSGYTVTPQQCTSSAPYSGGYTDTLTTGCPPGQPSPGGSCGFRINPNRWRWCPRGRTPVVLATMDYDVRFNQISLNGRTTAWPRGTDFFP